MARIAGVNLPTNKRVIIALTYIHGIGRTSAVQIADKLEIDHARRDTAPRAAITRLPQRKPRVEAIEPGIMDMGDLA